MFQVSDQWKKTYPLAHAGVLVMREVINPPHHEELERRKAALEEELRARFAGQDRAAILSLPILKAYDDYYRQFKKTYHVQLQLESIAFKGKSIPSVAALVEAMFMAEMKDLLLTAGHDLDSVRLPMTLDAAQGTETYTLLRGTEQVTKAGDMLIRDSEGIISSIIYGPDQRTQITPQTHNAVFTTYAPTGISEEAVMNHLKEIQRNVELIAPNANVELMKVFGANE
jgi:DNA/RNA-binding domain of Phe-tRNA-synthetase-like protein